MSDMEDVDRGTEAMQLESDAPARPPVQAEVIGSGTLEDEFVAEEFSVSETVEGDESESGEAGGFSLPLPVEEPLDTRDEELDAASATLAAPRRARRRADAATPPLRRILEAILFATDKPVTAGQLLEALPGRDADEVELELRNLAEEYAADRRGYRLIPCAGGYQVRSDPEMHEYVTRFLVGKRRARLSRAALETLAIVAYRQPITRGECEDIRGVDSGQVIHTLLERNLITIRGRSQALGRPLLYGTTGEFLRYFGINSLADLPSPEELQALIGSDPLGDPDIQRALCEEGFGEAEITGAAASTAEAAEAAAHAETATAGTATAASDGTEAVDPADDGGAGDLADLDAGWAAAPRAPLGGV